MKKCKHHFMTDDFYVNLFESDDDNDYFFTLLLNEGYISYFQGITTPKRMSDSSKDNFYCKTNCEVKDFVHKMVMPDHFF